MMMSINVYIDGDILVYQSIWSATSTKDIKKKLDQTISSIMSELQGSKGKIAIKGKNNFRKDVYPEYKGNRKKELTEQEIEFFDYAYDYLKTSWDSVPADGMEADDLLAIWSTEAPGIIVSIDKDLLQVPGLHYNTRKKEYTHMSEEEASLLLHTQVLMGDSTDNIPGLRGIGKVKAGKVMAGVPMAQHLSAVRNFWQKYFGRGWEDDLQLNMDMIYLRRSMDDRYDTRTGKRFNPQVRDSNRKGLDVPDDVSSNNESRVDTRSNNSTNQDGSSVQSKETHSLGSNLVDF